jgi:hypothetical protein
MSVNLNTELNNILNEDKIEDELSDDQDKMNEDFDAFTESNKDYDDEIDEEARNNREATEQPEKAVTKDLKVSDNPVVSSGIIMPNFVRKRQKSAKSVEEKLRELSSNDPSFSEIKPLVEKKTLDLSQLFQTPVIAPVNRAPINADTYTGKLAILAQKERDAKARARDLCINTMSSVGTHLENWMVI